MVWLRRRACFGAGAVVEKPCKGGVSGHTTKRAAPHHQPRTGVLVRMAVNYLGQRRSTHVAGAPPAFPTVSAARGFRAPVIKGASAARCLVPPYERVGQAERDEGPTRTRSAAFMDRPAPPTLRPTAYARHRWRARRQRWS